MTANRADAFSRSPDPVCQAVLVYGPDEGLVQERCLNLLKSVVEDPRDPFRVVDLENDQLKKDPALLSDEAAALSMMGGRKVIRVKSAGDLLANLFKDYFQNPVGDALIVVEGGDLPGRSRLRKVFEDSKQGAALPCYKDDEKSLPGLIRQIIEKEGLFIENDALAFLVGNLGTDRRLTRREVEKLCLYKGINSGKISLQDVVVCVGDTASLTLDDLAAAVAAGKTDELEKQLLRAQQEHQNPITILRAVSRYFQRLHLVSGLTAQSVPLDKALGTLRPPLFWKAADAFKLQVRKWSPLALTKALSQLMETEAACKKTGAPSETLCARTLLELTAKSPARAR
ncbi:DNA polymerase III subunit delta [Kiloniella laminariae]|uniref:DNA polymerase III subunit delta n=1 Tax=Kiloniella laminariae TaxID=454162 RepID=A0ABT4LJ76_9PROT|nr:DNA polymerase III subunit delta [Kiloniella laminariae]MCZ4281169.1 DNA polymerase III subunit delta [Kiloniella laminariae]